MEYGSNDVIGSCQTSMKESHQQNKTGVLFYYAMLTYSGKRRKLNELTWNLIAEKLKSYANATNLLVSAAPSVSKSLSNLFKPSEQPEQPEQRELDEESGTPGDNTFSSMYKLAVKKFQGNLRGDDYVKMELVLWGQYLQQLQSNNLPVAGDSLDQASSTLLDDVLDNHATNLKTLLLKIQQEKIRLIQSVGVDNDSSRTWSLVDIWDKVSMMAFISELSYLVLADLENGVHVPEIHWTDNFGDKLDDTASELTFYWKFAKLLHIVLKDLDVNMADGETVSSATKLAMEHNETLYGCDATTSFGRKIDLLMKIDKDGSWDSQVWDGIGMGQGFKILSHGTVGWDGTGMGYWDP
ncbi:unnamed protein product [Absidia cylindrospora]